MRRKEFNLPSRAVFLQETEWTPFEQAWQRLSRDPELMGEVAALQPSETRSAPSVVKSVFFFR